MATLRVLGCSPAWPNPGEACSGYLVDTGRGRLLLDCGTGVLARLRLLEAPPTAIVLSHLHADHLADLVPLAYALRLGNLDWPRPSVHLPPEGLDLLGRLAGTFSDDLSLFANVLDLEEYDVDVELEVAGAVVTFERAAHPGSAHALRVEADGRVLGYTGDGAPHRAVESHLQGADVLLAEATSVDRPAHDPDDPPVHSTAEEAALLAAGTGAGRLVLTHVPAELRQAVLAAARRRRPDATLALPDLVVDL